MPTAAKVRLVEALAGGRPAGGRGDVVRRARAVPQLADADEVLPAIGRLPGVRYPVLVPNMRGLERAEAAGADAIAVFTAASEAFAQANIRMTIEESLEAFEPVLAARGRPACGARLRLDGLRLPLPGRRRAGRRGGWRSR